MNYIGRQQNIEFFLFTSVR